MDFHDDQPCMFENTNGSMQAALDAQAEAERANEKLQQYMLYFTDQRKPLGQRFLGACIVEAHGIITAVDRAYDLGINPGDCEVIGRPAPAHDPSFRDRLIVSDEEMAALGFKRR
jgi:hypothetical protein